MLNDRKKQHLDIFLSGKGVSGRSTGLENIRFEHVALPELDMGSIDLGCHLLGRAIKLPFLVSSMTGGPAQAARINQNLAIACEALSIPMAVGSQRIAIETELDNGLNRELRQFAPSIPLLANIGAAQLVRGFGLKEAERAVHMIEADALIVHLNALQEAVQPEGDRNWSGVLRALEYLSKWLPVPLVVKEVGFGISPTIVRSLREAGITIVDIAGAGGTSWTAIEAQRAKNLKQAAIASAFIDWGQSTAHAISTVRALYPDVTLIGSGGIHTGVDAAKAIRLGADLVGQAGAVLKSAIHSPEAVIEHFDTMAEQLRIVCFCTGSTDLAALRKAALEEPVLVS